MEGNDADGTLACIAVGWLLETTDGVVETPTVGTALTRSVGMEEEPDEGLTDSSIVGTEVGDAVGVVEEIPEGNIVDPAMVGI